MCWDSCKRVSHVLGFVQRVSHKLEVFTSKGKNISFQLFDFLQLRNFFFIVCLPHIMAFVYIFTIYINFECVCVYITIGSFALLI